ERLEILGRPEAFDRRDLRAVDRGDGDEARAPRLAVDEDGARAAAALLAPDLGAVVAELLAEHVEQRRERWAFDLVRPAVDAQVHRASSSWASARRTSTGSACRRYQAEARASSCGLTSLSAASPAAWGSDAAASAEASRTADEPAPVAASRTEPSASRAAETASAVYSCVCGRSSATKAPAAGSSKLTPRTSRPLLPRKSSTGSVVSPPAPAERTCAPTAISAPWRSPRGAP